MECPHLMDSVKINRDLIKAKRNELGGVSASAAASAASLKTWRCLECQSAKENWMCLNCGTVLCGRYENCHALKHSTDNTEHKICMNMLNFSVYCYKCDEFVINDTASNQIDILRREFRDENGPSETASPSADACLLSSKGVNVVTVTATANARASHLALNNAQETASTSSSDSGWEEPSIGRKLRPRKRTISSDSGETTKRKTFRKIKVVGLRNLGNTCFMNSVLQSLSNIQEFSCYFSTLPSLETKPKRVYHSRSLKESVDDANVVEELRKILLNLSQGGDGSKAISPECLFLVIWKVVPQFRGHRQHDAHEFLRYMLDRLHTELQQVPVPAEFTNASNKLMKFNAILSGSSSDGGGGGFGGSGGGVSIGGGGYNFKGRSSIVTNVFGGILQSEVRCLICGMESKKHDPFLDLSLDIPEKFYKECDDANSKPVCNIADCLSSFTEIEELAETELYYCSSCKCKQKSTKRFWIRRLPHVLCLHIKRFRWNNFFRTKIDLRISFPINELDMSQYVLNNGPETRRSSMENNVYDLAAVIVHHGNGSSCGHYTSFAWHANSGIWLHFNDHTVKEVAPSAVADCKPYILFYIRRDMNASTKISS